MKFNIDAKDTNSQARSGTITTDHGVIETPIFMPVGTQASVKGIHFAELEDSIKAQIILGNTYHLFLRPGLDIIREAGGLHGFTTWERPMLTDSGGYQIFSLADRIKITEEGALFHSHIDGSKHQFTPERAVEIQRTLGADFFMAFDECPAWPASYEDTRKSMELTHRWLRRCWDAYQSTDCPYGHEQAMLPIVQGGTFADLRKQSCQAVMEYDSFAYAIGGLSVGEPKEDLYAMTEVCTAELPQEKPRYLMGVGTPENLLECIALGVDMFDCVMPTRNGRNGMLFTHEGIVNIKNRKWATDFSPISAASEAITSRRHSKAYLRHLFVAGERLGPQIASLQNLSFYLSLMAGARKAIQEGVFSSWKDETLDRCMQRL